MKRLTGYLRLMRPANIITALSDILAGVAIAGYLKGGVNASWQPVFLLLLATAGLYGGGVVFNDVFDAELDAVERPERPIPSGLISKSGATLFALFLLLAGVASAAFVRPEGSFLSFVLALLTAAAALIYDKWGKHHSFLGPLNMGLCRGLNLLLGMSILPPVVMQYWPIALVPVLYIAAITMISRGEVHGGKQITLYGAAFLYLVVIGSIITLAVTRNTLLFTALLLALFAFFIFRPLLKAIEHPIGPNIGKAVKAGVISLILMNAAWAAAFGNFYLALVIVALLPVSLLFARLFAVT